MTIAEICIFIAGVLPYVVVSFAKSRAGDAFNNATPRDTSIFNDFSMSAYNAHLNSFESFPLFAAAVIIAEISGVGNGILSVLAIVFIAARIAYIGFYLKNMPTYRSASFAFGFFIVSVIFFSPLFS